MGRAGRRAGDLVPIGMGIICVGASIASGVIADTSYAVAGIADVTVGIVFAVVGLICRPRSRATAWLAFATAITWVAGSLFPIALYWHRGPLLHLILRGTNHRTRPSYRVAVGVAYAASVWPAVWGNEVIAAVLATSCLAFVLIERGPATTWVAALIFTIAVVGHSVTRATIPSGQAILPSLLIYDVALIAIAVLSVLPLLVTPRVRVTDLMVELRGNRSDLLRDELAAAIGDRTLRIAEWDSDMHRFVAADGTTVDADPPERGRATTLIDVGGRPMFILEHAPGSLDDPALRDAVVVAARVTARNAELRATTAGRITEIEASRRRLLVATDLARLQLGGDVDSVVLSDLSALDAGALADLEHVTPATAARLAEARLRISSVRASIEDTITGLAPRELTSGVMPALHAAARRSPHAIGVEGDIPRMPPATEVAVAFACLEAMTNAVKHSGAARISVSAEADAGTVRVTISDDGQGGADTSGWGITGMVDRIVTVGGSVTVESVPGDGTDVRIAVPLAFR